MRKNEFIEKLNDEVVRTLLERVQGDYIKYGLDNIDIKEEDECTGVIEELNVPYINRTGVPLVMDIIKPDVDDNVELPVIVIVHGGGLVVSDRMTSRHYGRYLAKKGYLVFTIEYRLVPRANVCEQLDDVCAGLDLIGKRLVDYNVDFSRIFLLAESAGAYLAVYVAAMKKSKLLQDAIGYQASNVTFKAIGLLGGMLYTNKKDPIGTILNKQFYGDKVNDDEFMKYSDPDNLEIINNLPPIYLITSRGDFLNKYSIDYHNAIKKAGGKSHLVYYGNDELGHAFVSLHSELQESKKATDKMLEWFENIVKENEMSKKEAKVIKNKAIDERLKASKDCNKPIWKYIYDLNQNNLTDEALICEKRSYSYAQMFREWERYA